MSESKYPYYDDRSRSNGRKREKLTYEQREKKGMGLQLEKIASQISQQELDVAKATFFENGGKVTYLNTSRITDKEIRKFVNERFADEKFVDDVASKSIKKEVE